MMRPIVDVRRRILGGIAVGVIAASLLTALVALQLMGGREGTLTLGRIAAIYYAAGVFGGAAAGFATLLGNGAWAQVSVGAAGGLPVSFCMYVMMFGTPLAWSGRRWVGVLFVGAVMAVGIFWGIRDSRIRWD